MSHTLVISDPIYQLLSQVAQRQQLSPNELAEQFLQQHLSSESQAWQAAFEQLLVRVHARMSAFDPAEIEADITAAFDEVKRERRARHRLA